MTGGHGIARGIGTPADEFFQMCRDVSTLVSDMKHVNEKIQHIEGHICGEPGKEGLRQRIESLEKNQERKAIQVNVWKATITAIGVVLAYTWGLICGLMPWAHKIAKLLGM